jgi:AcrR family transcriptional regulator
MPRAKPADPRKRPRQERSRATVEALVTAAERLVERGGAGAASTNRIAEVAGVSVGSLYQYFPNRDSLIEAVRERQGQRFGARAEPEIERLLGLPLRDAARGIVELVIALHRESLRLHNALHDEARLPQEFHERWLPVTIAYLEARRGELRPANLELAARIGLEALEALTHGVALRSPALLDDPEYAEELTQLLVHYLEK